MRYKYENEYNGKNGSIGSDRTDDSAGHGLCHGASDPDPDDDGLCELRRWADFSAALADILLGAAAWAPWTLVIKSGMAVILGLSLKFCGKGEGDKALPLAGIIGMMLSTAFMTGGYYLAEAVMYGNWITPVAGVVWNMIQGAVGTVIACALTSALKKTPAKKYFSC